MRLNTPLLRLPIDFSAEALEAEVRALPPSAWQPHPTGFVGNEAVRLVTPDGEPTDAIRGAMAPTEYLRSSPYIMEIMGELGGTWGRSRLMGLAPGAQVPPHVDCHYYWRTHLRIHIPVITNPGVTFTCGGETVHMKAGECWVFDSFQVHQVRNDGDRQRVHLVLDTVGGEGLWDLIDRAQAAAEVAPLAFAPGTRPDPQLTFEQVNSPKVMSPWEMQAHVAYLAEHVVDSPLLERVLKRLDKLIYAWRAAWAEFGDDDRGLPTYRDLMAQAQRDLGMLGAQSIDLRNTATLGFALEQLIFLNAIERPRTAKLVAATNRRAAS